MSSSDVACAVSKLMGCGKDRRVFYPVALASRSWAHRRPGIRGASFRHRRSRGRAMELRHL